MLALRTVPPFFVRLSPKIFGHIMNFIFFFPAPRDFMFVFYALLEFLFM